MLKIYKHFRFKPIWAVILFLSGGLFTYGLFFSRDAVFILNLVLVTILAFNFMLIVELLAEVLNSKSGKDLAKDKVVVITWSFTALIFLVMVVNLYLKNEILNYIQLGLCFIQVITFFVMNSQRDRRIKAKYLKELLKMREQVLGATEMLIEIIETEGATETNKRHLDELEQSLELINNEISKVEKKTKKRTIVR